MDQEKYLPKSTKIFENKNIWLVLLKVMFPQILGSLVNGLYILISQIFLNLYVPKVHPNQDVWQNYNDIYNFWYNNLKWKNDVIPPLENVSSIVHSAVAISLPLVIAITAVTSWLSMGVSMLFGAAVGRRNTVEAQKIWTTWFFPVLIFCAIVSIVLGSSSHAILYGLSGSRHAAKIDFIKENLVYPTQLDAEKISLISAFYATYYRNLVSYSVQYALPIIIILFLQVFVLSTWFCLASEGKQLVMVGFSFLCNLIDLAANYLLIKTAHLGMLGGGLSVMVTYLSNAILLIVYLAILDKRSLSLMTLNLFHWKIDWIIFSSILLIGLSSLFRNISSAFTLLLFQTLLVSTTRSVGQHFATYWLNFGGAVMPIQNLLFSTAIGTIRGTRVLFNYHLAAGHIHYAKEIFLIGVLYSVILMAVLFSVMSTRVTGLALMEHVFGLKNASESVASDALLYLRIVTGGMIMYGFMMVSMVFFQVAGRILSASLTAIFSGIGFAVIVFPIAMVIAKSYNNMHIYLAAWTLTMVIAGTVIFAYTWIYITLNVKPGYKIKHPVEHFDAWLKKLRIRRHQLVNR